MNFFLVSLVIDLNGKLLRQITDRCGSGYSLALAVRNSSICSVSRG